jgi:tetratricopeptide (TPR) repeat protein/transglutaminase-like putative cysteine protease
MSIRRFGPLYFTCLLLVPASVRGEGQEWPVPRGPAKSAAPCSFDPAVCKKLPTGFLDDAPACVLFSGTTHRLLPDGTIEMTTQELIRLNGRKGIDQLGEYKTITFSPSYETVTLHEARVHKAKGGVEIVSPRHVRLRDVNTDHQVYDTSKELVISFPGLEVGDVMEIHWTTRGKHPEYQGQFFYRYTFGHDKYPVARDEWTIRLPKDRVLRQVVVNGPVPLTITEDGNEKVYRFAGKDLAPPPQGDRMPPADERQCQAYAATFDTWEDVRHWEHQLIADRSDCPPEGKKIVDEVVGKLTDPVAKARVLAQWVRGHIRYVSSGEKHDYTPYPPARVLAHRYGDCKDTAHLLAVLARQAGLHAGEATLGVRGDGQVNDGVPCPWGSHALCVITIDGEDHFVDTTAEMIGWDVLPKDDRDRACYITDETTIRLTRTPVLTPADNATVQSTTVTVGTDGSIKAERSAEYRGVAAWNKRDDFVDTPVAERRRLAVADLVDSYSKAKLKTLSFENLDDYDKPFVVKMTFEEADHFAGDKVREGSLGDTGLWTQLLGITINPERKAAIDAGDPFASVCRYVVILPPSLRFAQAPSSQRLQSEWGTFKLEVTQDPATPHRLEMTFDTRVTKTRVEPAEFEEFQTFQDSVQACFRAALKLKQTDDLADAPLLEAALAKTPNDAAAAEALADLYVAKEKFDEARRVLEKAREARPEVKRLWELSVAAAADEGEEEELLRAMADRFKDDPKFALSLGQNLIEQNKNSDARKVFEPLAEHADGAVKCAALLGLAHVDLAVEEPKKALKHLKAAEAADKDAFGTDGWVLRAQTHEALGDRAEAMKAYQTALEEEADSADVLEPLVRLAVATGQRDVALGYLRQLVVSAEDDADSLAAAADAYARLGRFDDALELAGRAKSENGQIPEAARRAVGLAMANRGEPAKAVELLAGADPDALILTTRIRARLQIGDLQGAATDADAAKRVEEPSEELRDVAKQVTTLIHRRDQVIQGKGSERIHAAADKFVCAEHFYTTGQAPDRVTPLLDDALAGDTPLGPAFGLRAVLAVGRGRLTKALPDAEKAIQLAPTDFRGFLARGRIRFERIDVAAAVADLQKAVELSKHKDAAALHSHAAALMQLGRWKEAFDAQNEAIKLQPKMAEYREQLTVIEKKLSMESGGGYNKRNSPG